MNIYIYIYIYIYIGERTAIAQTRSFAPIGPLSLECPTSLSLVKVRIFYINSYLEFVYIIYCFTYFAIFKNILISLLLQILSIQLIILLDTVDTFFVCNNMSYSVRIYLCQ